MKILRLTAENVKRLTAVEITPDGGSVVVIGGENEAGKSSVLDAIEMALGGQKRLPAEPIRRGADSAKVIADLGDFIVTRRFTKSGTTLTVTNRDGAKYPSPQALLDGLVGRLTFDPLAFASMDPDPQAVTLRALAKIDTSDLETARKQAYDERTLVNRDVTQTEGLLAKQPAHPNVGIERESLDALTQQLRESEKSAKAAAEASQAVALSAQRIETKQANVSSLSDRVDRLRYELEQAEGELAAEEMTVAVVTDEHAAKVEARDKALAAVPDRAALMTQIADIESRNRLVVENQKRAETQSQVAERKAAAEALTARIERLDAEKVERLAAATFPLVGLGLDDQGVTWQGLPFSQASTAVRTRVSVAIGLALNPTLKVLLVRNGNDLGPKNLQLIADLATAAGAQVWIERIDGAKGLPTIVIEDGTTVPQTVNA